MGCEIGLIQADDEHVSLISYGHMLLVFDAIS